MKFQYPRIAEQFIITGALCIVLMLVIDVNYYNILPFLIIALIGNRVPALDARLHLGHRNPILHSFLVPLLISIVAPKNIFISAFFVGFTAHMIADLDNPNQEWVWIGQKFGIVLLWISFFVILGIIFGVSPMRAANILG